MLRRQTEKLLLNSVTSTTIYANNAVDADANEAWVNGLHIKKANLVAGHRVCYAAGTAKVMTVTITHPYPTQCDCPPTFELELRTFPDIVNGAGYNTDQTFPTSRLYYFEGDTATATAADAAAAINAQINADKYAPVTSAVSGANSNILTLTAKSANYDFAAYASSALATIATTTAWVRPKLTLAHMQRLFPNKPGYFGGAAELPSSAATYCKYYFKQVIGTQQDIDSTNWEDYISEIEIYVNNADSSFAADWHTRITAIFDAGGDVDWT